MAWTGLALPGSNGAGRARRVLQQGHPETKKAAMQGIAAFQG